MFREKHNPKCQTNADPIMVPNCRLENPYTKEEILANRRAIAKEGEIPTPEELIIHLANQVRLALASMKEVE